MITATIITLSNDAGDERDVAVRGDAFELRHGLRHLDRFIKAHGLTIINMVGYQQPSFSQSLHYHLTGEVI